MLFSLNIDKLGNCSLFAFTTSICEANRESPDEELNTRGVKILRASERVSFEAEEAADDLGASDALEFPGDYFILYYDMNCYLFDCISANNYSLLFPLLLALLKTLIAEVLLPIIYLIIF